MKMKKPLIKHRAHRMLFDDNLPFKGRKERNRLAYSRKAKHKNKEQ